MRLLCIVIMIAGLLISSCSVTAKTYYIDYRLGSDRHSGVSQTKAWQRCPGMNGFSGIYRHQSGDRFVFKGGCVWPATALPLTIQNSGSPGAVDFYTTDHSWFSDSAWSQPVLSAQHSRTQLLFAGNKSYFVINDLAFIDFGRAGIENGGKALDLCGSNHYAITRCTIAPQAWIGLYIHSYAGRTDEDILIDQNDISAAGQAIVIAVEAPNSVISRIIVSNNSIHDLSSQIVGATHGDGIHTWNSVPADHSQFIQDLTISNNRFFGNFASGDNTKASMTALIYITDPGKRTIITGNDLSYSKATHFSSLIWVLSSDSVQIVKNTLTMDTAQGGIGIIVGQGDAGKRVTISDNVITGAKYCYYIYPDAIATTTIDRNACITLGPTVAFWNLVGKTWEQWQALGYDGTGRHTIGSYEFTKEQ